MKDRDKSIIERAKQLQNIGIGDAWLKGIAPEKVQPPQPERAQSTSMSISTPEISEATLTKPVDVRLKYGNVKLPSGMKLKILSRNGSTLFADYLGEKVEIPIEATTDVR